MEEKKDNEIKSRIVGGGNKQRTYTSKQEASSSTSHIESIFCTATIDAMENRDVVMLDIPNAFVQTDLIKNGKAVKIIMAIEVDWQIFWSGLLQKYIRNMQLLISMEILYCMSNY